MAVVKKSFWTVVKEWALVTLGILIYVTGWALFLMPNNLVGGGVSGISSMIQYATGGAIQMGYSYFVLNAILIILAVVVIGMGFGAKTIYAIILASVGLRFLPDLIPTEIIQTLALQNGKLMSTLCGGLMAGNHGRSGPRQPRLRLREEVRPAHRPAHRRGRRVAGEL